MNNIFSVSLARSVLPLRPVDSNNMATNSNHTKAKSVLGGAFLIAGTSVGAGMLGLPVKMASVGFSNSIWVFIGIWLVMTFTALLMLEVSLWLKGETNFISMANATLGSVGKNIAWLTYLFFLYSLMAAYTAGGTTMLLQSLHLDWHIFSPVFSHLVLFILPFVALVFAGAKWVDFANRGFMLGLILAYASLVFVMSPDLGILKDVAQTKPSTMILALPLLVTSFGFHLLIPTLKTYLHEDVSKLRKAIILGSAMPLIIYITWEFVICSVIPLSGTNGLLAMQQQQANPAESLITAIQHHHPLVASSVACFTFFALASSFVGVGLGLFDFFSDGLNIPKDNIGKMILILLTFVPPVIFTLVYPTGFLLALSYAGVFAAILLVIYPVLMAWKGRNCAPFVEQYQVWGGKVALAFALLFGVVVVCSEILSKFSIIKQLFI